MKPLDLVAAHPWRKAYFTTYALSLSFFEAAVLDGLVRGGGREAVILSDEAGIRAALSEHGARRVGRDYEVQPVVVTTGVFHPKVSAFLGTDDCHILVGSGNLTFGGWGGNLEVLEHLHPSFAARAINDVAEFFEFLTLADNVEHGASEKCLQLAGDLRSSTLGAAAEGEIRVAHNLATPIGQQIVGAADELGGATKLTVVSPYWDNGSAVDQLCAGLGLDHYEAHVHEYGTTKGKLGANWPRQSQRLAVPVKVSALEESKPRLLHAKAFEVLCARGRIAVSGSANATSAALWGRRNVEVSTIRIQRERLWGWTTSASEEPLLLGDEVEAEEQEKDIGVLWANLEGDSIAGRVLGKTTQGTVMFYSLDSTGAIHIGTVENIGNGHFSFVFDGLEARAWNLGRIVLRAEGQGWTAEGFVSFSAYTAIARKAGALAPRLFALLSGTEAPADVAAIMSWFNEDPSRTLTNHGGSNSANEREFEFDQRTITIPELSLEVDGTRGGIAGVGTNSSWTRFMAQIFSALRENRGPIENSGAQPFADDYPEEDTDLGSPAPMPEDPKLAEALATFRSLLNHLLRDPARFGMIALDLTQYIANRLQPQPEMVASWLGRITGGLNRSAVKDRQTDVCAAILAFYSTQIRPDARGARALLKKLDIDLHGGPPPEEAALGFLSALIQRHSFDKLWDEIKSSRTFPEQAAAYKKALETKAPGAGYAELAIDRPKIRDILDAAVRSSQHRQPVLIIQNIVGACPLCNIALPTGEKSRLQSTCVAKAVNCCHKILLLSEEY